MRPLGSWWGEAPFGPLATIAKSDAVVPVAHEQVLEVVRDVLLVAALESHRADLPEALVGRARRARERCELVGVLHGPQP